MLLIVLWARYFSKDYINFLLTAYFLFFGASALTNTIAPVTLFLFQTRRSQHLKFSVPYVGGVDVRWGASDVVALAASVAVCAWYAQTKHWILNNVLGLAFSVQGIALLSLGSYKNGAILLGGLFIYDVFWVFGTDVMVSVAKSFDAPIKLTFPRNIFAEQFTFSMLGLGDIVIPGFFVALLLRFDKVRRHKGSPFFQWSYRAYIAGLLTTIGVMHVFKAAQPALLYLVPFCLGASFVTGVAYGEWTTPMGRRSSSTRGHGMACGRGFGRQRPRASDRLPAWREASSRSAARRSARSNRLSETSARPNTEY